MSEEDKITPVATQTGTGRIRWQDDPERGRPPLRRSLSRRMSTESVSRAGARTVVDPSVTLPIEYRTV